MNVYIGNEKGGCGKSTTTLLLSLYIKKFYDDKIAIIDSDIKQEAIKRLMVLRTKSDLLTVPVVQSEKISKALKSEDYLILIDGRANVNKDDSIFMNAADFVLVPCGTTYLDVQSTKDYITALQDANIPFKVVFTAVDSKKELEEARESIGKDNCFKGYFKHSDRYRLISKTGETDLDDSFINPRKWLIKREVETVVEELYDELYRGE